MILNNAALLRLQRPSSYRGLEELCGFGSVKLEFCFEAADQNVLSRLEQRVGTTGTVLQIISDRQELLTAAPLTCGVPLGSFLGPALFSLQCCFCDPFFIILFHSFAGEIQIYLPIR